MTKLAEIRPVLVAHKAELRRRFGVKEIGIFGSSARGEAGPVSDIDVMVEFERPIGLAFTELAEYLEKILGCKVDLVSKRAIKPKFLPSVEEDLIYV